MENKKSDQIKEEENLDSEKQANNDRKSRFMYMYVATAITIFLVVLKLTNSIDWDWLAVLSPVFIVYGLGLVIGFFVGCYNEIFNNNVLKYINNPWGPWIKIVSCIGGLAVIVFFSWTYWVDKIIYPWWVYILFFIVMIFWSDEFLPKK